MSLVCLRRAGGHMSGHEFVASMAYHIGHVTTGRQETAA